MKTLWTFILFCCLSASLTRGQTGIGLINTEIDGPRGTGKQIWKSYALSHNTDPVYINKSKEINSLKKENSAQKAIPRKTGKIYKLKLLIKSLLTNPLFVFL